MADISPSTKKVDDFLSSLSHLSQERIREDRQRQRNLQRNIDELRSRSNSRSPVKNSSYVPPLSPSSSKYMSSSVPSLKFNRSIKSNDLFLQDLKELEEDQEPPPLPEWPVISDDESPPSLPKRPLNNDAVPLSTSHSRSTGDQKIPPPIGPKSSRLSVAHSTSWNIELLQPVARKIEPTSKMKIDNRDSGPFISSDAGVATAISSSSINSTSKFKSTETDKPKQYKSFTEIENNIKYGYKIDDTMNELKNKGTSINSNYKPPKPAKGSSLSSFSEKTPQNEASSHISSPNVKWHQSNEYLEKPASFSKPRNDSNTNESLLTQELNKHKLLSYSSNDRKSTSNQDESNYNLQSTPNTKADWLSSSIKSSKINQMPQGSSRNVLPPKPKKSDWLSSTLSNSKTTISPQDSTSHTPSPRIISKSNDWLSSLSNSKSTFKRSPSTVPKPSYLSALSAAQNAKSGVTNSISRSPSPSKQKFIPEDNDPIDVSIIASSSVREKKPTSWIDSAVKKSDWHNYIENPSKPLFKVAKGLPSPLPKQEEPKPELLSTFEKLKSAADRSTSLTPVASKPKSKDEINHEYLSQFEKIKKNLTGNTIPISPKHSKPSIGNYTEKENEILKTKLAELSIGKKLPPPKPAKPSLNKYEENDTEILKSQMKKLGSKSVTYQQLDKKDVKAEGLLALNKLKPVKKSILQDNDSKPEALKKFETMKATERKNIPEKLIKPSIPKEPEVKIPIPAIDKQESNIKSPGTSEIKAIAASTGKLNKSTSDVTNSIPTLFQAELAHIIRASTVPENSNKVALISRSNTEPITQKKKDSIENGKLTHPNKSRAKGPKRRLPKNVSTTTAQNDSNNTKTISINYSNEAIPEKLDSIIEPSIPRPSNSDSIPDFKHNKRIPPPINKNSKPKITLELKPSRDFSGEVFI